MPSVETQINVHLPDGSTKALNQGSTAFDLAAGIADGLKRRAVGALINTELKDLHTPLKDGDQVKILSADDPESIELLRHSTAHVMAEAVQRIFPEAKIAIGPTIEDGFYYDFDIPGHNLEPEDLERIEKEMHNIASESQRIVRYTIPDPDKQVKDFQAMGEKFKAELLEEHKHESPTLYLMQDKDGKTVWNDLCRGPHLPNTGLIKAFKLLKASGSYWRGDEHKDRLQRIYATAFWKQSDVDAYLKRLEEAEKRDHRKLGKELELFHFDQTAPGMPYWLPNGMIVLNELLAFWRTEHEKRGYQEISSPLINEKRLWEISGHWDHYKENMFVIPISEYVTYGVKPMNCPNAMVVFNYKLRSYRDLPLRLSDCDTLHRNERSGTLHGLLRVQKLQQDDAHIFIDESMIEEEYSRIFDIADLFYGIFNLKYSLRLGTRPQSFIGDIETWNMAEAALKKILDQRVGPGLYTIAEGDGAFYGPKIDILMEDAIGRSWQMGTIQLDFQLPRRFNCKYIDADGNPKTPVVVHRVIYGALERFIGILIEHTAGALPVWLAPIQARIIPISDKHTTYCMQLLEQLRTLNLRVDMDDSKERMQAKVREAQLKQVPYMLVVGDREMSEGKIAVRHRRDGDLGSVPIDEFISKIKAEIQQRS